jgi:hypothetical protein
VLAATTRYFVAYKSKHRQRIPLDWHFDKALAKMGDVHFQPNEQQRVIKVTFNSRSGSLSASLYHSDGRIYDKPTTGCPAKKDIGGG